MSDLRVLIVSRAIPLHHTGGMETVAWDLAKGLQALGATVTVLTTTCGDGASRFVWDGVEIRTIAAAGRYSKAWWEGSRKLYEAEFEGRYDCVLSISIGALAIAVASPKTTRQTRFIMQSHGTAWSDFRSKLATRKPIDFAKAIYMLPAFVRDLQYRALDAIVAIGPAVAHDLTHAPMKVIVGPVPVHRIDNGVDTRLFRFSQPSRDSFRGAHALSPQTTALLCASRLHPQKGVQHALGALAIAIRDRPDQHLLIAGDGPFEEDLRQQAQRLKIEQKVTFLGKVSREKLPEIYSAADIFLFPTTRVEGLPLILLEALACGLPVVASRHIILQDQVGQYPIDPLDYAGIARVLQEVPIVRGERSSMLNEVYSLDAVVGKYVGLMSALKQQRSVAP